MMFKSRRELFGETYGKCICWSIPFHQLSLIEVLDRNAKSEDKNRSEYLRKLVIDDDRRKKQLITHPL